MLICPNCSHSNQDDHNFCEKCGANLKTEVPLNSTEDNTTEKENIPGVNEGQKNDTDTSKKANPAEENKPQKKFSIVKIALALVGIFFAYILFSNLALGFSPVTRLLKGLKDFSKGSKFTTESTMGLKYKGSNDALSLLNNISVEGVSYSDTDKLKAEASFKILYNEKDLTEIKSGFDNEMFWIDPMKLYNKGFYYEFNKDIADAMNDVQIYKKAIEKISLDFNKKELSKIIKDSLGRDLKNSLGKVTLTLDYDNTLELLSELLEYAQEDEKLMNSIRKNGISFIKTIIKEGEKDKLEFLYDEDTFEMVLEIFEDEKDFEDYYENFIANLQYELEEVVYGLFAVTKEYEITFNYGLFNNLKNITYEFTIDSGDYGNESIKIDCVSSTRKGAKFSKFNTKKAENIEDLMDDPEELMDIAKDVVDNLTETITDNKDFKKDLKKIEDTLGIDIDDLSDNLDSFFYYMW